MAGQDHSTPECIPQPTRDQIRSSTSTDFSSRFVKLTEVGQTARRKPVFGVDTSADSAASCTLPQEWSKIEGRVRVSDWPNSLRSMQPPRVSARRIDSGVCHTAELSRRSVSYCGRPHRRTNAELSVRDVSLTPANELEALITVGLVVRGRLRYNRWWTQRRPCQRYLGQVSNLLQQTPK